MPSSTTRTACWAVNTIDASALESPEAVNHRLKDGGVTLDLSEVKSPIMYRLKRSHFLQELTGKVHLTQFDAVASITPIWHGACPKPRDRSNLKSVISTPKSGHEIDDQ